MIAYVHIVYVILFADWWLWEHILGSEGYIDQAWVDLFFRYISTVPRGGAVPEMLHEVEGWMTHDVDIGYRSKSFLVPLSTWWMNSLSKPAKRPCCVEKDRFPQFPLVSLSGLLPNASIWEALCWHWWDVKPKKCLIQKGVFRLLYPWTCFFMSLFELTSIWRM